MVTKLKQNNKKAGPREGTSGCEKGAKESNGRYTTDTYTYALYA